MESIVMINLKVESYNKPIQSQHHKNLNPQNLRIVQPKPLERKPIELPLLNFFSSRADCKIISEFINLRHFEESQMVGAMLNQAVSG